jgi:hypothetical protein
MTQKQKDEFSYGWRVKYLNILSLKRDFLNDVIGTNADNSNTLKNLAITNYQIELCELEHKIFFETIVMEDWKLRVVRHDSLAESELLDARENFESIYDFAKKNINIDRIKFLVDKKESVNLYDDEQLITYYKSIKVELQKNKLIQ